MAHSNTKNWLWIATSVALSLQWIVLHASGVELAPHYQALSAGLGIFGAAFMLSWAAEMAQFDIPQSLALAFLALIAVLPEYAVDMYFAWRAGKDPSQTQFALANMTGSNRLLIGLGWAAVVFTYWLKSGKRSFALAPDHKNEIFYLGLATIYSFVIPYKGQLQLFDAIVLVAIFIMYVRAAAKTAHVEPEVEGPAEIIVHYGPTIRRLATLGFFFYAGYTIYIAAEPFAEGLIATGRLWGIEEFLLVQWLAPLASESPEFIVAILFAFRSNPGASMSTLLSSKVNQWTLLVGMLPVVYMISAGQLMPMHIDERQVEELFLTAAQSFFAVVILANLTFTLLEAGALFVLFGTQLLIPDPRFRFYYSMMYVVLGLVLVIFSGENRRGVRALFRRAN